MNGKEEVGHIDSNHQETTPDDIPESIRSFIPELKASLSDATVTALAVLGNVDAGKSTLTACLCDRILDDGNGYSRSRVFLHNHEQESGRTSDVSSNVIEYSENHIDAFVKGSIHNEVDKKRTNKTRTTTTPMKIVGLHDLCGHERYFGTTSHGVSSMRPDYGILVINPSRGVLDMTKEHFKIAISLNVPVLIVITKVDSSLANSCKQTEVQVQDLLKRYGRKPNFLNSHADYEIYRNGEEIFIKLRDNYYEMIGKKNKACGFVDLAAKMRYKIQATRDELDSYMVSLKMKMKSIDGKDFMAEYNLDQVQYDELYTYVFYRERKMKFIDTIVSGLNIVATDDGPGKQSLLPVLYMSNFNGYHLDTVRDSIMFLQPRDIWDVENNAVVRTLARKLNKPDLGKVDLSGSIFYMDRAYTVEGAGLVVSGINRGDTIRVNSELWVGPINKNFVKVKVKSIHNDARQYVDSLDEHHRGCLNLTTTGKDRLIKRDIKKGMVLISDRSMAIHVAFRFKAVITVLKHETKNTTLRIGACPLLDAGTIKQSARLLMINDRDGTEGITEDLSFRTRSERKKTQEIVKPNQVKEVTLKFTQHPEFIPEGEQFIFRSGTVHGVGVVLNPIDISNDIDAIADPVKKKHRRVRASSRANETESDNTVSDAGSTMDSAMDSAMDSTMDSTIDVVKVD